MKTTYKISKVITNNLVRATDIDSNEVILTGCGIGYSKKTNDLISSEKVENVFVLQNKSEADLYNQLLTNVSPKLIEIANSCIIYIQSQFDKPLTDHIHISLTDHICFLVKRYKMGIPINNPFSYQTNALYPKETEVAQQVLKQLNAQLHIEIPAEEVSFITLHIVSALSDNSLANIVQDNYTIQKITETLEEEFGKKIDKSTLNYARFVTHLKFMIERVKKGDSLKVPSDIIELVKDKHFACYALSWKLAKIVQQQIRAKVSEEEIILLSLHLFRFTMN